MAMCIVAYNDKISLSSWVYIDDSLNNYSLIKLDLQSEV